MTEKEYQEAIPPCCKLKTAQQHLDVILLCWGITHGYVQAQGEKYCDKCDMREEI